jgi:hypothetical protein
MLLAISKSREVILDLRMNQECPESACGRPTGPLIINLSCMKGRLSRIVLMEGGGLLILIIQKKSSQVYGSQILLFFGNNWSWVQSQY